ncbi:MAG: NUDIX hydrolase [Pseudomonadota bacterium]
MTEHAPKDAIRNAATVILIRSDGDASRVLMGQRGKNAAFFPNKFVFPGGAIDPQDHLIAPTIPLGATDLQKLQNRAEPSLGPALAMTAIRELWEETGQAIAVTDGDAPVDMPSEWAEFYAAGHRPSAAGLRFVFRAITPPGRPRRFDARFFMTTADDLAGDPDDFSRASDELSHLSWLTLSEARNLDLPTITEIVLAEVEARLKDGDRPVPFFYHENNSSHIDKL